MSRTVAPEPTLQDTKRPSPGSATGVLARIAGTTNILDAIVIVAFFVVLPVERVFAFDVAGFTIRPAYACMAVFLLLHLHSIRAGFRAMPTAALIALAVVASLPLTFDPKRSAGYAVWAAFTLAFALAAVGYLREDGRRIPAWVELYCATAAAWGVFTIGQWFASFADANLAYSWLGSLPRIQALGQESSFFAFYLIPPLFLSLAARRKIWAVPIILAIILSTSRSGLVGMTIGAVVLLILGTRDARLDVAKGVVVAGVAVAALAVPVALNYQPIGSVAGAVPPAEAEHGLKTKRIDEEFLQGQDDASTSPRLQSWKDAVSTWRQAPATGVGIGAYGEAMHERGKSTQLPAADVKTTNLWVEALAELGPLGFLALLLWVLVPVPYLFRERRRLRLAVPLIAAIFASSAMFAFTQTWWVPYRWIPWLFAYALVGPALWATLTRSGERADERG
jgi:O-antigen ligase